MPAAGIMGHAGFMGTGGEVLRVNNAAGPNKKWCTLRVQSSLHTNLRFAQIGASVRGKIIL
jgi:hypothetical protein